MVASLKSQPHGGRAFTRHTRPDPRRYGTPPRRCLTPSIRAFGAGRRSDYAHADATSDPERSRFLATVTDPRPRRFALRLLLRSVDGGRGRGG